MMTRMAKKFLKTTKLTDKIFKVIKPYIKFTLTVLAVFTAVMLISTSYFDKKEQSYLAQMKEFEKQAKIATRYSDSLRSKILVHIEDTRAAELKASIFASQARQSRNTTNKLLHDLDSLREMITDSLEMARVIIPKQDSIISQQQTMIDTQDTQITFLNVALSSKDTALTISIQRGDSLQRVVDNIPTPPSPPVFPKITRKQAFLGGIVSGVLLTALIL